MGEIAAMPTVNVAILRFDRTEALIDGRVRVDGCNFIPVPGGKPGVEGFLSGAFDAADIPFARFVLWKAAGMPIIGLPVFTDRIFQHEYVYTRSDSDIGSLSDLRMRKVMCAPSYFSTPSFWHRALLKEETGITPDEIDWFSAFPEPDGASLPKGVKVTHIPSSMLGLERLLDGTVDCLMTARTAIVPPDVTGRVRRVIKNAGERLRSWYAQNRYFPIAHVVAVHSRTLQRRPDLPHALCAAFDQAKDLAYRQLQDERMTALPFMRSYLDETVAMCGEDPWPYGYAENLKQISQFLGYAFEQGLTSRLVQPEELFSDEVSAYEFKARMRPGCITGYMDGGWALESMH